MTLKDKIARWYFNKKDDEKGLATRVDYNPDNVTVTIDCVFGNEELFHHYYKHVANDVLTRKHDVVCIKKVIFNNPATIVMWADGTKTVVKAENEEYDPEKGLAMAISKKALGNKGSYYETFKKWLPDAVAEEDERANPYHDAFTELADLAKKVSNTFEQGFRDDLLGEEKEGDNND